MNGNSGGSRGRKNPDYYEAFTHETIAMIEDPNVHRLTFEDKEIILIGTAHVSKESAQQVEDIIEAEKPDTVCVELCRSRYDALTQKTRWQETDLLKAIKEKKAFLLLSNLMLTSFQRRLGKKLGIRPGEEILRAINAAEKTGAAIHLADRDIRTTLSRTWRLMRLFPGRGASWDCGQR